MKKVIIYLAAILCIFLSASCTTDDYNQNTVEIHNTDTDDNGGINTTPPKKNG